MSLFSAKDSIADMVIQAVDRTKKRRHDTRWEKQVSSADGTLTVVIDYPPASRALTLLKPKATWNVHFQGNNGQPTWTVKFDALFGVTAEGSVPLRLKTELWEDLKAILP